MIQAINLSKSFGKKLVLDEVSFDVGEDEVVALVGNNGSGKTTLFNLIVGNINPSRGSILVGGNDAINKKSIGGTTFLCDEKMCYFGADRIEKIIDIHSDFSDGFDKNKCLDVLKEFRFDINCKFSKCSKGRKMQFNIAIALATQSEVLLLDEPTSGLDEMARYTFNNIIKREIITNPRCMIISSHLLGELESVVSGVLIIKDDGKIMRYSLDETEALMCAISGKKDEIDTFIVDKKAFEYKTMGQYASAIIFASDDYGDKKYLRQSSIQVQKVSPKDTVRIICNEEACIYKNEKNVQSI